MTLLSGLSGGAYVAASFPEWFDRVFRCDLQRVNGVSRVANFNRALHPRLSLLS